MKKVTNLRGWTVLVTVDGQSCLVTVVTHTRKRRWLVEGKSLPERFQRDDGLRCLVVDESKMTLVAAPKT